MATIWSSCSALTRADRATPACCSEETAAATGYLQQGITNNVQALPILTSSSLAAKIFMTWFPMNWWRCTLRQMVWFGLLQLKFAVLEDYLHNINTVPGSVWWSQEQQSTSHHACISSALDPLWRMELYRYHSENLIRNIFNSNKYK